MVAPLFDECGTDYLTLLLRFSRQLVHQLVSFHLLDNEFNYSHFIFVKMGSVIPQLNPHSALIRAIHPFFAWHTV